MLEIGCGTGLAPRAGTIAIFDGDHTSLTSAYLAHRPATDAER
ncbi:MULTISPECIES: hypothetical protein [Nonomuraea]|uniref:Class I SAM-dependent methyltransferase n=1 Tax=Nonomuraea mangrovi TaxID=2316207 RepID=A0ABW4SQZ9_9ACTN